MKKILSLIVVLVLTASCFMLPTSALAVKNDWTMATGPATLEMTEEGPTLSCTEGRSFAINTADMIDVDGFECTFTISRSDDAFSNSAARAPFLINLYWNLLFFFENGKVARVELSAYQTQTRRRKLTGAYSDKSPLVKALALDSDEQMVVYSTDGRAAIFSTAQMNPKTTRNTQGVAVMSLKKKALLADAVLLDSSGIVNQSRYRTKTIPSAGALLKEEDSSEKQQSFEV